MNSAHVPVEFRIVSRMQPEGNSTSYPSGRWICFYIPRGHHARPYTHNIGGKVVPENLYFEMTDDSDEEANRVLKN